MYVAGAGGTSSFDLQQRFKVARGLALEVSCGGHNGWTLLVWRGWPAVALQGGQGAGAGGESGLELCLCGMVGLLTLFKAAKGLKFPLCCESSRP